jgi:hypothetical protein
VAVLVSLTHEDPYPVVFKLFLPFNLALIQHPGYRRKTDPPRRSS